VHELHHAKLSALLHVLRTHTSAAEPTLPTSPSLHSQMKRSGAVFVKDHQHRGRRPGSPVWSNVPPRNKNFIGREGLLATLRDRDRESGDGPWPPQPKTLLACVASARHRWPWSTSTGTAKVRRGLVDPVRPAVPGEDHAGRAGSPSGTVPPATTSGIEDAARDTLNALRRGEPFGRWLLVFDNADQPEDLLDLIPRDRGHVLITSRKHRWGSLVDALPVDVFRREGSVEFLTKRGA
jgi:hypothetical protein